MSLPSFFISAAVAFCTIIVCQQTHGFSVQYKDVHARTNVVDQDFLDIRTIDRRSILVSSIVLSAIGIPQVSNAVIPPATRDVDVGGGFDLLGQSKLSERDVIYPISMEGSWICTRTVTQVEGDTFQAESAWKALGGGTRLTANQVETYPTRYMLSTIMGDSAVVLDRGYDISSRSSNNPVVKWNVDEPDTFEFNKMKVTVVKRTVETPTDQGFGFNELYRIDDGLVTRAAQVKRRYRRAFDEKGNRVVEGLEIMKTFRVLDGIAGIEMPTSTTKSQLRMTRL